MCIQTDKLIKRVSKIEIHTGEEKEEMNWESKTDMYTLPCVK